MRSKDVGEQNKLKILQSIVTGHPEGKSTSEISRETGLHRDTIHTLCKELIAADLIVKGSGKWGKYRLTEKATGDLRLLGWIFFKRGFKQVLRKGDVTSSGCKYSKLDFENISRISDKEFKRRMLFNSALLTGAYFLYVFLKSFEPAAIELPSAINRLQKKIKIKTSGSSKDELAQQWIKNAIQPYAMLAELHKLTFIKRNLKSSNNNTDDLSKDFNAASSEEGYRTLISEFAEVFSGINDILEKEWRDAIPKSDKYRNHYSKSTSAPTTTRNEAKKEKL
jgi:hypothetical protein